MNRRAIALGCVFALGAAIAFPASLLLGGGGSQQARAPARTSGPFRQVYSPALTRDSWFIEQQRRNVEALEQACRTTGEFCAESRLARQRLIELQQKQ